MPGSCLEAAGEGSGRSLRLVCLWSVRPLHPDLIAVDSLEL